MEGARILLFLSPWDCSLCIPVWCWESWKAPGELLFFTLCWNPQEVGFNTGSNRIDQPAIDGEGEDKKQFLSSMSFYVGCPQEVWMRFRMSLPSSNDQLMKIHSGTAQQHEFKLIPHQVMLTIKVSHDTSYLHLPWLNGCDPKTNHQGYSFHRLAHLNPSRTN